VSRCNKSTYIRSQEIATFNILFSSGQATTVEVSIALLDIHSVEDSRMASRSHLTYRN